MGSNTSKLSDLSTSVNEATAQLQKNREYLKQIDTQMSNIQTNINVSVKELKLCNASLNAYRKQMIDSRASNSDILLRHTETKKTLENEIESQKQQLTSLQNQKLTLESAVQKLEIDLETSVKRNNQYALDIQTLIGEQGRNQDRLKQLQTDRENLVKELQMVKSKGNTNTSALQEAILTVEKQIIDINKKILAQKAILSEKAAQLATLEDANKSLSTQVTTADSKLKQLESTSVSDTTIRNKLLQERQQLLAKRVVIKEAIDKLTISQEQKDRAIKLLSEHSALVKSQIEKLSKLNMNTSANITTIKAQVQKDADNFKMKSSKQKEEADQKIKDLETRLQADLAKLQRLETALQAALQLQQKLKAEDQRVTKQVDDLTADLKKLNSQLLEIEAELSRLKQAVINTQTQISGLNTQITQRLDGQFFKKESSKIYTGQTIAETNSSLESCLRLCAENANCVGFTLSSSNQCILKSTLGNSQDSSSHTSYLRYSLAVEKQRKTLATTKANLDTCDSQKAELQKDIHDIRPTVKDGKCQLLGMPVRGWFQNNGICYQGCPEGSQGRDAIGRCLCGDSDGPNKSCSVGTCQNKICKGHSFDNNEAFNKFVGEFKPPANNRVQQRQMPDIKPNCKLEFGKVKCADEITGYSLFKDLALNKEGIYSELPTNNVDECIQRCNNDEKCAGFTYQKGSRTFQHDYQRTTVAYCYLARKGMFAPGVNQIGGTTNTYFKQDPKALTLRQNEFVVKLGDLVKSGCCFSAPSAANFGMASSTVCYDFKECLRMGISTLDLWTKDKTTQLVVSESPSVTYEDVLNDSSANQKPFATYQGKNVHFVRIFQ
jgi:hypothetical protein